MEKGIKKMTNEENPGIPVIFSFFKEHKKKLLINTTKEKNMYFL